MSDFPNDVISVIASYVESPHVREVLDLWDNCPKKQCDDPRMVALFAGLGVYYKNSNDDAAFIAASEGGHIHILELIHNSRKPRKMSMFAKFKRKFTTKSNLFRKLYAGGLQIAVLNHQYASAKWMLNHVQCIESWKIGVIFLDALVEGHLDMVKLLTPHVQIDKLDECFVMHRDYDEEYHMGSVLHLPAFHGHLDIVQYMVAQFPQLSRFFSIACIAAAKGGHVATFEFFSRTVKLTSLLMKCILFMTTQFDHVAIIESILKHDICIDLEYALCSAAKNNSSKIMSYLLDEHKVEASIDTLAWVAKEGDLEKLKQMVKALPIGRINERGDMVLISAAAHNQKHIVEWLISENHATPDHGIAIAYIKDGNPKLEMLQWFIQKGAPQPDCTLAMKSALHCGSVDILEWLLDLAFFKGLEYQVISRNCAYAFKQGHLGIIRSFVQRYDLNVPRLVQDMTFHFNQNNSIQVRNYVLSSACEHGQLDMLMYFHQHGVIMVPESVWHAAYSGQLATVIWLLEFAHANIPFNILVYSIDHLHIIRYFVKNHTSSLTKRHVKRAIKLARTNKRFDIVEELEKLQ